MELMGPARIMKFRIKSIVQGCGRRDELVVDVVRWDSDLGKIVEDVVEEDLRWEHRQERKEHRCSCHAEHVSEVRACPHEQVLHDVAERLAPLEDPGVQDIEPRLEEDDVGGIARDVDCAHDGDADVGGVQRGGVVDAVAQEGDDVAAVLECEDDPIFLRGGHAREDRGLLRDVRERGVVHRLDRSPRTMARTSRPTSEQTCLATSSLSPVTIFTITPSRRARRVLRAPWNVADRRR